MDVLDQLGALREGKLSRRAFNRSLFAAGISTTMVPLVGRRAMAAPDDQATLFTWGGYDVPQFFDEYKAKHGEVPKFATFASLEEANTKLRSGFVADLAHPCLANVPQWIKTGKFQPVDTSRLSNWPE